MFLYFILPFLIIIFISLIFTTIKLFKMRKRTMKPNNKIRKVSDEKIMEDLKFLQKQLLVINDPAARIEIIKKIELISSIYN